MKKILFYYTHRESLGHTTRVLNIVKRLKDKYNNKVEITVLNGGAPQEYLTKPLDVSWQNLPFPYYSKTDFLGPTGMKLFHADWQQKIDIRRKFILNKINRIKPDIFITEYFPFGRNDGKKELLPLLSLFKKWGGKLCASIGYPQLIKETIESIDKSFHLYDLFLMHTPEVLEEAYFLKNIKTEQSKQFYLKFFSDLKDKIKYTGYVIDPSYKSITKKQIKRPGKDKIILVSRGGGVVYPKIILFSILAAKYLDFKYKMIIIPGPSTYDKEMDFFISLTKKMGKKEIIIKKYLPNFMDYLSNCDLTINMAGYNTSTQLLFFKKRSIIIPYEYFDRQLGFPNDQIARKDLLKYYLDSTIMEYKKLNASSLAKAIDNSLNQKLNLKDIPEEWFQGSDLTADILMQK